VGRRSLWIWCEGDRRRRILGGRAGSPWALPEHPEDCWSFIFDQTSFPLSMLLLPVDWVLPPSGLGAQLHNGLFVDGIVEVDFEAFSDIFNSILKLM
jgi:hypothetical protein